MMYTQVDAAQMVYDTDGNLVRDDRFVCAYDAENRMLSARPIVPPEGDLAVVNAYDHKHRRTVKRVERFDGEEWQTSETHTFAYDGSNIVLERITFTNGSMRTVEYFWGNDLSGSEQGAGGVGGLLATRIDGVFYVPVYGANGNVMMYVDAMGAIAAQFDYDPYGRVLAAPNYWENLWNFAFSTKYHDWETDLVAYQLRTYDPIQGRWLNRDPIEEAGGENLYVYCGNSTAFDFDFLGCHTFKFTDSGWTHENIFSGRVRTKVTNIPIKSSTLGVIPYILKYGSRCDCIEGKYVPNYTFEVETYTYIQDVGSLGWSDNSYGVKVRDPRVKNYWNMFWRDLFGADKIQRRIELVKQHEERHRKHARTNYERVVNSLDSGSVYHDRSLCEMVARMVITAAVHDFESSDSRDAENVEKGEL